MKTYAFGNSLAYIEIYETGDFEDLAPAVEHAIEIWEEKVTIRPAVSYLDGGMLDDREAAKLRDECIARELAGLE